MSKVYLPSRLRMVANNQTWIEIEACTIQEILLVLIQSFPEIRPLIMDDNQLNLYTRIFINNCEVRDLDKMVQKNDTIHIIQAMAGG